jgi:hypothetical protein
MTWPLGVALEQWTVRWWSVLESWGTPIPIAAAKLDSRD